MNKDRLIDLAEWCEAGCPERGNVIGFDMNDAINVAPGDCGAVCCLAGAATQFYGGKAGEVLFDQALDRGSAQWQSRIHSPNVRQTAMQVLGIDDDIAYRLFEPCNFEKVTPAIAARTLRHLAATGEVRWEHLQD